MNMVELHAQMIAVLLESGMSLLRITCFSDDVGSKGCSFMCRAGTDCVAYKRDSLTELSFDIHVSSWQITMGRVFDNAYFSNGLIRDLLNLTTASNVDYISLD